MKRPIEFSIERVEAMRKALDQIVEEGDHIDTCPWYTGEGCNCHVSIAARGLGVEVE